MITNLHIKNFFSFKDCSIDLHPKVNILVGINGSGKSNLLKAVKLLNNTSSEKLSNILYKDFLGGNKILFLGNNSNHSIIETSITLKNTPVSYIKEDFKYKIELTWWDMLNGSNHELYETLYSFDENGNSFVVIEKKFKKVIFEGVETQVDNNWSLWYDYNSLTKSKYSFSEIAGVNFKSIYCYSNFDTSLNSKIRGTSLPTGDIRLDVDGSNLPQILNTLKINDKKSFNLLVEQLTRINPKYKGIDFNHLANNIELMLEESSFNKSVHVSQVSDGTLKFLCLMAVFYNPNRGSIVCIDEPETGLHPDMLIAVADGIKYASETSQMIISTHSPLLLNLFELENIRVFEKDEENATVVKLFDNDEFQKWRSQYLPGELWTNGHLGGVRW